MGLRKIQLLPPSPGNPRNSEGAIIQLKDGTLLLVYTRFYGSARRLPWGGLDNAPALLAGRVSADCGSSWSPADREIIGNEGDENVMSVSLLRLGDGTILLGYLVKNSSADCRFYIRRSEDEGKNWGKRLVVTEEERYFVVNNDRLVQLSGGRLLVPACRHRAGAGSQRGEVCVFLSDDSGLSWKKSGRVLESPVADGPAHRSGLQEPGVVELEDGSVLLWARTDLGAQYFSRSLDGGLTWSEPEPSGLVSPCSPASIKRMPAAGDLLAVYNDHSGRFPYEKGRRTPLVAAISADGGRVWEGHRVIEDEPGGHFCYTSITFPESCGGKIVLSYCAGNDSTGRLSLLQVSVLEAGWPYHAEPGERSK